MTQSSLSEKQLAKLEEIAEIVKKSEETFKKLDKMSDAIAQKWERRREARKAAQK